jgi:hypothetical protein
MIFIGAFFRSSDPHRRESRHGGILFVTDALLSNL